MSHTISNAEKRAPVPVRTEVAREGGEITISHHLQENVSKAELDAMLNEACGTNDPAWTNALLRQMVPIDPLTGQTDARDHDAGIAFLNGMAPKNEVEAALLAQMFGIHQLAAKLNLLALSAGRAEELRGHLVELNRCARTFAAQAETLSKLRTGGKQTVEVKYVDARNSQNAFVANLPASRGASAEIANQGHAAGRAVAVSAVASLSLRGQDKAGGGVLVPGCQGQKALPDARRRGRVGRA